MTQILKHHNLVIVYIGVFMGQRIYVGNLGFGVNDTELANKFAQFGTVMSSKIIVDRDTKRSKGFGFVEMSSALEANSAIIGLNGIELEGRLMNVSEAKEMTSKTNSRY
jgi:RNA recognition motif-containing protein